MISVAAVALIAGTGLANAQGTGMGREGSSAGSTMQQSAPSAAGSSAGQMSHESTESKTPDATKSPSGMKATQSETKSPSGMKSTQSEQKSPSATKNDRAEDMQKSKSMSSDNDSAKDMKAEGSEDRKGNMKAEGREDRNGNMKAETKGTETRSQTTTGQAGAGAKLSTEQRTKITTVIRDQHIAPVNNVNFSISIGTRVPREVSFHPLPAEVVTVYPEWRGYEFFLVRDQIIVVDPGTLEIVAVLEA
jgi:hypothetical protein